MQCLIYTLEIVICQR